MRLLLLSVCAIASAAPLAAQSAPAPTQAGTSANALSTSDIEAAIQRGKQQKKSEGVEVKIGGFARMKAATGFDVMLEGPLNRIASESAMRAKKYLPYTVDSVSADLREPTVTLVASPWKDVTTWVGNRPQVTPAASHVVLLADSAGQEVPIQPTKIELFDADVMAAQDGEKPKAYPTKGLKAQFNAASLPSGAFKVRIIAGEKEYTLEVNAKQRAGIR